MITALSGRANRPLTRINHHEDTKARRTPCCAIGYDESSVAVRVTLCKSAPTSTREWNRSKRRERRETLRGLRDLLFPFPRSVRNVDWVTALRCLRFLLFNLMSGGLAAALRSPLFVSLCLRGSCRELSGLRRSVPQSLPVGFGVLGCPRRSRNLCSLKLVPWPTEDSAHLRRIINWP